jgi:hypothetical protein
MAALARDVGRNLSPIDRPVTQPDQPMAHLARNAVGSAMDQWETDNDARRTAALMGFIVILVLAIAGVVLFRELRNNSRLEDCLMAGRHNCAPIEAPPRR